MLDAGAEPGDEQHQQQGREAARPARRDETGARDRGPQREQSALAPALGQESGGDLDQRPGARVDRAGGPEVGAAREQEDGAGPVRRSDPLAGGRRLEAANRLRGPHGSSLAFPNAERNLLKFTSTVS